MEGVFIIRCIILTALVLLIAWGRFGRLTYIPVAVVAFMLALFGSYVWDLYVIALLCPLLALTKDIPLTGRSFRTYSSMA